MTSTQTQTQTTTVNNVNKGDTPINSIKQLIQHELQNKVITNLLNTITTLSSQLTSLQSENILLKKTISFLLKKSLLTSTSSSTSTQFNRHSRPHSISLSTSFNPVKPHSLSIKPTFKPTTSFLYTPTECVSTSTSKLEFKVNDYIKTINKRTPINPRKHYLLYKSPSSLYDDLFDNNIRKGNNDVIQTDTSLYKNNSQGQLRSKLLSCNVSGKKITSNRISYRNLNGNCSGYLESNKKNEHIKVNASAKTAVTTPKVVNAGKKGRGVKNGKYNVMKSNNCGYNSNNN